MGNEDTASQRVGTPSSEAEVGDLAEQVAHGTLDSAEYFAAIERRAQTLVEGETSGEAVFRRAFAGIR